MSLRDYDISTKLDGKGEWSEDFYALVMLAMRNADTANLEKLKAAWPEVWDELSRRYNSPQGLLPGESAGGYTRREDGSLELPDGRVVTGDWP